MGVWIVLSGSVFCSWDNGETERLSPWDMEPVNEERKQQFSFDNQTCSI